MDAKFKECKIEDFTDEQWEVLLEAISKADIKEPVWKHGLMIKFFECPTCHKEIRNQRYCDNCGQRLEI